MATFIGLLELLAWVLSVLSLAAVVTYSVIKIGQRRDARKEGAEAAQAPPAA